ncbi:MAG: deoxyribodipyrimidine photo-lyase [Alphaproteobacteria bacterium]
MTDSITIFWFRQDLRISDNPALSEAAQGGSLMSIYILDDQSPGPFKMGEASRWWLHHSLENLNKSLNHSLNFYRGSSRQVFRDILKSKKIKAVFWNECYEPWRVENDRLIKHELEKAGIECHIFNGSFLWDPNSILTKEKTPYKVFTPFYRKGCLQGPIPRKPLPSIPKVHFLKDHSNPTVLENLNLLPKKDWYKSFGSFWEIGEKSAHKKLEHFLENGLLGYQEKRNHPDKLNVSRLSPHLHFGEISPNQIWYKAQSKGQIEGWEKDSDCFLTELGWREFSCYLLYYFPELPHENFQKKFNNFPWGSNKNLLQAWQKGQTGIPIVDAGMRELWQTGYMHNRLRMIVASFLVKNLGIHWRFGEEWFWDCLVDADLASNSASWQWVAGSGADASPYFRIFNPVLQGEKFDSQGIYTRRFVPELENLPLKYLFKPWEAPEDVLQKAKITLGTTYPHPIVDLNKSRQRALSTYKSIRNI